MISIEKIDFVVSWVDATDSEWQRARKPYLTDQEDDLFLYRDYGTFRYWFRMVEAHAPWVNKIYLVTCGPLPVWLNKAHPKLIVVKHEDYIPKEYLPTFNSNVIELNLHRLPDLAENFVLFNDDMFLIKPVLPSDYYQENLPKLSAVYNPITPFESFSRVIYNNLEIINRHFKGKQALKQQPQKFFTPAYGRDVLRNLCLLPWGLTGYVNYHLPSPLKKSTLAKLWEVEEEALVRTSHNHIRDNMTDINHWLLNYWQIETNQFYPAPVSFGKYITVKDYQKLPAYFRRRHLKTICINDSQETTLADIKQLRVIFATYFPKKSDFER